MTINDGGVVYFGVDLAERHSAAVLSDEEDRILHYSFLDAGTASKPPNPQQHQRVMVPWFRDLIKVCDNLTERENVVLTVENIFPHAMNGIPAARMQGAVLLMATLHGLEAELVLPLVWQSALGYSKKEHGKPKPWALHYAQTVLGFEMPETQPNGTRMYAKQKEDLPDAYLINHWRRTRSIGS